MAFVRGINIQALGAGAGFAIWSFRAVASGCRDCVSLRRGFDEAFGEKAPCALGAMMQFAKILGAAGGRRILLAPSGCCSVTADELSIVASLCAAQKGDLALCKAHLVWLTCAEGHGASLSAATCVSNLFYSAGMAIAAPLLELSPLKKPITRPIFHETGYA